MNYLAHAYLSFNNQDILIGNMIADYVKGKQIESFSKPIQRGIMLHRNIDEFTDKHPVVKETKIIYREAAGRYDGSFLDITFDHFLALDQKEEPQEGWLNFTLGCYNTIDKNLSGLPQDFIWFYHHMKEENWLYNYRYRWLIEKNFSRFSKHIKYLPDNAPVYQAFIENYEKLRKGYQDFFPELKDFVKQSIQ